VGVGVAAGYGPSMPSQALANPRVIADKARDVIARVRPGPLEARRSLPVRGDADDMRRLWADADARRAILEGIPVADASLDFGDELPEWGRIVTVTLRLETPLPGMAAATLAGKVVRRLKALVETGEVPTTAHNPSARPDAGEEER
jgi:hypothetical protein